jgi:hypothetical protein
MLLMATIHGDALSQKAPVINEVLATQVALDRSGFSRVRSMAGRGVTCNVLLRIPGFHQLPATGQLDDQTWKQLAAAGGDVAPLVDYAITDADIAGPFTPDIPRSFRTRRRSTH